MFTVLFQSLVLASGGILSLGSITIVILLLVSDQGWRNGLGYTLGYVGAYTLIGLSLVLLGYNTPNNNSGEGSLVVSILFIILGIFLLWLTQRNWRKPPSNKTERPRLFALLDKITPLKAFAFGAIVTVMNVKNLAIFLSAISVLLLSDLLLAPKIGIALLVVLVFCLSVIIPLLIYVAFPNTAHSRLTWIRHTLETHSRAIGIWVPLIFGLIFLMRGLSGLL